MAKIYSDEELAAVTFGAGVIGIGLFILAVLVFVL